MKSRNKGVAALAACLASLTRAQLGRPAIWLLPMVFPLLMAFGGFAGLVGLQLPAIEVGIALSAVVLGGELPVDRAPAIVRIPMQR